MNQNLRNTKQILQQISQIFKDDKNPNNINLTMLRQYIEKDPNLAQSQIFKKKLQSFGPVPTISRRQFQQKFYPDCSKREHFQIIFDLIDKDKSGKISKRELELLNKEYQLNFTKSDLDMMVNFVSKDGQKVFKEDLFRFVNS